MSERKQAKKKRSLMPLVIIIIAIVIALFIIPGKSSFKYEPYEGGYRVVSYNHALFDVNNTITIPETYDGKPVVAIGEKAFYKCTTAEEVIIPASIKKIGISAFEKCKSIKNILIPESVTYLPDNAFKGCVSLEEIIFSPNTDKIGARCFADCKKLDNISIPTRVNEISYSTFENCESLKNILLHDNITSIKDYAFKNCRAIETLTLPAGIKEISEGAFEECDGVQTLNIPNAVTKICTRAFYGCDQLYSVFVPDSVKKIEKNAFKNCKALKSIELPKEIDTHKKSFGRKTDIKVKEIADASLDAISKEITSKTIDKIYMIYDKELGKDRIMQKDGIMFMADSDKYEKALAENHALLAFDDTAEISKYLNKAKNEGVTDVIVYCYSELGTKEAGKEYFMRMPWNIDQMIRLYDSETAKNNPDTQEAEEP